MRRLHRGEGQIVEAIDHEAKIAVTSGGAPLGQLRELSIDRFQERIHEEHDR
jgi:hypothetical protein